MLVYPPLYILRHGQTCWNAEHRVQGRLDSPLTELGRSQAADQGRILRDRDLSGFHFLSSPQGRAFQTAAIALEGLAMRIDTDPRLAEITVGEYEGRRRSELPNGEAAAESEESALHLYDSAPGGEGFAGLRERCVSFLETLSAPSVLVTHGMTSRMLRLIVLGMDVSEIGALPGGQGVVYYLVNGVQHRLTLGA
ncbi:histidine phosphatase family protein [uncultured Roseobacter sp.]|uniref:histidine phosphatase family protein n=1 Tax=uncultured Roseobacter sp. TaxID=114847 RepID=UPI00263496AF|nr:histidine phosphatase family protein [uncultured Roseobacter sp.]